MKESRRDFIKGISASSFLIAAPNALWATGGRPAPSGRINLALIGCGTQGMTNLRFFLGDSRVQVTTVCDPILSAPKYGYSGKDVCGRDEFRKKVDAHYKNTSCKMTADWREVVNDPSIDAVCICTPDHWHAIIAIAAMKKGKHVYCQKPMTNSIGEGIEMTKVAKETGVVFQVGSQHRSTTAFRTLGEMYLNGCLGECKYMEVGVSRYNKGCWGHGTDCTPKALPAYFAEKGAWSMWQGPAEHFADDAFIPGIHEPMVWRWNRRYGGGSIPDTGSHWFDAVQWMIGRERTGPVRIENMTSNIGDDPYFSWPDTYSFDLIYDDGFVVHSFSTQKGLQGLRFVGSKCSAFAVPWQFEKPECLKNWTEADIGANGKRLYAPTKGHPHESDFIDGIFERRPISTDCEIGHRSATVCHIANICAQLRVSTLTWDPKAERFTGKNAEDANKLINRSYHNGWKLNG